VLGTWLFVAFWVLLGFGVFFVAVRGGLRGAREPFQAQTYGARRTAGTIFVVLYVGFGVALPLVFLLGNHDNANGQVGGNKLTPAMQQGRLLFGEHCGVCHTLVGANAIGKVGPNLVVLKPSESLVLHTIQYGCLQTPPPGDSSQGCLGQGVMPAVILQGRQAADVAKFVAQVAGRE
jgi:mono/diheme cytochrome c family protein